MLTNLENTALTAPQVGLFKLLHKPSNPLYLVGMHFMGDAYLGQIWLMEVLVVSI